jgi:predicted amidohydrolase
MKICIAQSRSVIGDIEANLSGHLEMTSLAASAHADMIVFPELSLTGYEPEVAVARAIKPDDLRLQKLQNASDQHQISIGAGIPIQGPSGVSIEMLIFQPNAATERYVKSYLHEDELPFFTSGQSTTKALGGHQEVALAICYEIAIPQHARAAAESGARYYLASVAKTVNGVEKASARLAEIASTYQMTVLMANCVGECEGQQAGGKSGVWRPDGSSIARLDELREGLIIFDTDTQTCTIQQSDN